MGAPVPTGRLYPWAHDSSQWYRRKEMSELDVGPIDYLALEFPDAQFKGEGLRILLDLVDAGAPR